MSLRRPPIDSLTVDDLRFAVRWSARRRTVGITVKRDGELVVAAPRRTSARRLEAVVRAKLPWVRRKLAEFEALGPPPSPGRSSPASASPTSGATTCSRSRTARRSPSPSRRRLSRWTAPWTATRARAVVAWYEARARDYIGEAVARFAPLVGAAPAARRRPRPRQAPLGRLRPPHAAPSASTGS